MDSFPSVDQFAEVLSQESEWYTLGVFLGAPIAELREIGQKYGSNGIVRCLIELHCCLERKGKLLSWETIATAVRRMGNNNLADKIHSDYILPFIRRISSVSSKEEGSTEPEQQQQQHPVPVAMERLPSDSASIKQVSDFVTSWPIKNKMIEKVGGEFQSLFERFVFLTSRIQKALKASTIDIQIFQDLIEDLCGLAPLPHDQAMFEVVFKRLKQHCSILNFRALILLVENLLNNDKNLQKDLRKLTTSVENFKKSIKMIQLVSLIKENQQITNYQIKVKLKVRNFWKEFTMKQFETVINEILDTLYEQLSHITVGKGCICVTWDIPNHANAIKLVPELPLEFIQIIGVISLHIGDTAIYDIGGEGCETIEAAMLEAIKLNNTRAIELLLAVGCSPEVATYNEDNTITAIVNIREKSGKKEGNSNGSGDINHVCILGHNEHIEAIVDPDPSKELDCSSCRLKDKMMMGLQHEISERVRQLSKVEQKVNEISLEYDALQKRRAILLTAHQKAQQVQQQQANELTAMQQQITEKDQSYQQLIHQMQQLQNEKDEVIQRHENTISKHEEITRYRDNPSWLIEREEVEVTQEVVGRGGWGEVKVGMFRGTRVAVKALYEVIISDYWLQLFSREMDILSCVHHPNLVQFIGATRVGNPQILTELMPTSLRKELEMSPMTRPQVLSIGIDVASGLNYLHCYRPHPILHRNISSANVLLELLGNGRWKAKLADFISANLVVNIQTVDPGSPVYSAPEAHYPSKHSPAMDIYSFGVLLTEMATHQFPPLVAHEREAFIQTVKWPAVKAFIIRCIATEPSSRPTANNALEELRNM